MGGSESKESEQHHPHHKPHKPPATLDVSDVFDNGKKKVNPTFGLEEEAETATRKDSFNGFGDDAVAAGEVQYEAMIDDEDGDAVAKGEVTYTAVGFGEGGEADSGNLEDDQRVVYVFLLSPLQNSKKCSISWCALPPHTRWRLLHAPQWPTYSMRHCHHVSCAEVCA